eukprot:GSMAST32.ASY1.ANO1.2775.1 assembled CDS
MPKDLHRSKAYNLAQALGKFPIPSFIAALLSGCISVVSFPLRVWFHFVSALISRILPSEKRTEKELKRAEKWGYWLMFVAFKGIGLFFTVIFIGSLSILLYIRTYRHLVPKMRIERPLYFDYTQEHPSATVDLVRKFNHWEINHEMVNLYNMDSQSMDLTEETLNTQRKYFELLKEEERTSHLRTLAPGYRYTVTIDFVLPRTAQNADLGVSMLTTELRLSPLEAALQASAQNVNISPKHMLDVNDSSSTTQEQKMLDNLSTALSYPILYGKLGIQYCWENLKNMLGWDNTSSINNSSVPKEGSNCNLDEELCDVTDDSTPENNENNEKQQRQQKQQKHEDHFNFFSKEKTETMNEKERNDTKKALLQNFSTNPEADSQYILSTMRAEADMYVSFFFNFVFFFIRNCVPNNKKIKNKKNSQYMTHAASRSSMGINYRNLVLLSELYSNPDKSNENPNPDGETSNVSHATQFRDQLGVVLARSIRPLLLSYSPWMIQQIRHFCLVVPLLFGFFKDEDVVSIVVFDGYREKMDFPTGMITAQLSNQRIRVKSANIRFLAQLTGMAYFMHHYWKLSFIVGISAISCGLMLALLAAIIYFHSKKKTIFNSLMNKNPFDTKTTKPGRRSRRQRRNQAKNYSSSAEDENSVKKTKSRIPSINPLHHETSAKRLVHAAKSMYVLFFFLQKNRIYFSY